MLGSAAERKKWLVYSKRSQFILKASKSLLVEFGHPGSNALKLSE